jgi:hypothetical protein
MRRVFTVAVVTSALVSAARQSESTGRYLASPEAPRRSAADHRQAQRMSGLTSDSSQFSITYQVPSSARLAGCTGQTWR